MKSATAKEVWVIFECPHCQRPQTINKYVKYSNVGLEGHLQNTNVRCKICDKPFSLILEAEAKTGS